MKLLNSFSYACQGLKYAFRTQLNFRIHTVAATAVVFFGFVFSITPFEWGIMTFCIGLVISAELLNTALEKLCDLLQPGEHPEIKAIKDLAAGAVLSGSLASCAVGMIIFSPKIFSLI